MDRPEPIYTEKSCSLSCPLQWGVSAFWREDAISDDWLPELTAALAPDGIRLHSHRLAKPQVSQFFVSTKPEVAPVTIVQRLKGRSQHLLRAARPKLWKGNYAIRSIGKVSRAVIENCIADQVGHHRFADPRACERLEKYQICNESLDLSETRSTSHGRYWYNLHLVIVRRDREAEWDQGRLLATRRMIVAAAHAKRHLLSRASILPDHAHILLGCQIEESPLEVVLSYMNNLAYVHGMQPVFQFGAFVGTVGEYTNHAIQVEKA